MATLDDLFDELERAVALGDADKAYAVARAIERRIVADPTRADALEARLREALAGLDRTVDHEGGRGVGMEAFDPTRAVVDATSAGHVQPVWFGTDRARAADGRSFTHARAASVTRGRVDVWVPKGHRFGETGASFWRKLLRRDFSDDKLRIQGLALHDDVEGFFAEVRACAAEHPGGHALFFLHGYKNTFEDAAIRAAQLAFDLGVPGPVAFFAWPSRGSVVQYVADGSTVEASEPHITDFFVDFVARSGAAKVHVIGHSMGNRALLRAIEKVTDRGLAMKLGQVFLAAPDVDRDVFLRLAPLYARVAERTTLYASDGDRAVQASAYFNGAPRAGYFEPYTIAEGVDTVAVPDFDIDLLGHSYFAQASALLNDMSAQMRADRPPGHERHMDAAADGDRTYWTLRR